MMFLKKHHLVTYFHQNLTNSFILLYFYVIIHLYNCYIYLFLRNEVLILSEQKDKKIINFLLNHLHEEYKNHKYFNTGESSTVILLNDNYLIKQNTKLILQAEIEFLKLNNSDMFQKIIYVDPKYEFVVYKFIPGETMHNVNDIKDTIHKIVSITNSYTNCTLNGFGYLNEETSSWIRFLKDETTYSSLNLKKYIPNKKIINSCLEILEKYPFEKKLLHGDFGTHNFIQDNGKLVGVIDPMPVIGDYLYDLLFAIVSNVNILSSVTLEDLYTLVNEPSEKIKAMLTIVLYCRISRCLKYHPEDLDTYMNFWNNLI